MGTVLSVALAISLTPPQPATPEPEQLAALLRALTLQNLPVPLIESDNDWGEQRMVANGLRWEKKGLVRRPEVVQKAKNHGLWQKVKVYAVEPESNLAVAVREIAIPEDGVLTFQLWARMPCWIVYDRQRWNSGVRVLSTTARARCIVAVRLDCEATSRLTINNGLPEFVFRFRVTDADFHYADLHVDHLFGVGGDGAEKAGEMIQNFINRRRPEYKQKLLEQANTGIVKAADTKEIRVSVSKLLGRR